MKDKIRQKQTSEKGKLSLKMGEICDIIQLQKSSARLLKTQKEYLYESF